MDACRSFCHHSIEENRYSWYSMGEGLEVVSQDKFSHLFSSCNFANPLPCAGIRQSNMISAMSSAQVHMGPCDMGVLDAEKKPGRRAPHTLVFGFSSIAVRGHLPPIPVAFVCFCKQ
jgi:hypothetical protein